MRWTQLAAIFLSTCSLTQVLAADAPPPASLPAGKRPANIWLDKPFPPLKVSKWLRGEPDRKGKVTILAFWRSDSPACGHDFIAGLSGDQLQWRDDLVVISLNSEPADVQRAFFEKTNLPNYYPAIDDGSACAALNPPSLPYVLILDSAGVVRWQADADFLEKAMRGDPAAPTPLIIRQIIRADNGVARRREHLGPDTGEAARQPAAAAHPLTHSDRELHAKPMVGKPFPELKVGQWLTPEPNRKGKVLLIDFWGTQCGACIRNMPELNELQAKFKDDLVIIGMNPEPVEDQRKFMAQHKMAYSVATVEETAAIAETLEVDAIPNVFIVGTDGIVLWQGVPGDPAEPLTADLVGRMIAADRSKTAHHK